MVLLALFIEEDRRRLEMVLLVVLLLQYHNSIRDRHYLHRSAIVQPLQSPWMKLYTSGDDSSFLHMTGLNRQAFTELLEYIFDLEAIVQCSLQGYDRIAQYYFRPGEYDTSDEDE